MIPWAISVGACTLIYTISSVFGDKLRKLPGLTIPLFFLYTVARSLLIVFTAF